MTKSGIVCTCSKLVAQMPIINPNKAKLMQVKSNKDIIASGWEMVRSIKTEEVASITTPINSALELAAPT